MKKKSICLIPKARSLGGPATFQRNLIDWGEKAGVRIHYDADNPDIDAYLVIGGPKKYLLHLIRARIKGIPVVHRLNGMNWIHRNTKCSAGYFIHSEFANLAIAFYRRFICNKIIYQSPFCEQRWNSVYGKIKKPSRIIYNGVDLQQFHPGSIQPDFSQKIDFLLVEGSFRHGMDFGLNAATELALELSARFQQPICFHIAGKTDTETVNRIRLQLEQSGKAVSAIFEGVCSREKLIALEQQSAFLFSSEIHAACPNSVIEALGCGLPVTGFDTGALKDVVGKGGIIVPYGNNPWKLENPLCAPLFDAAEKLIRENTSYRRLARAQAEENFSMDKTAEEYIRFCLDGA